MEMTIPLWVFIGYGCYATTVGFVAGWLAKKVVIRDRPR